MDVFVYYHTILLSIIVMLIAVFFIVDEVFYVAIAVIVFG
jgi:hypothetical protein